MDSLSIKLLPLEHKIWREMKSHGLINQNFILAVSGGLDSILMAAIMKRLAPLHKGQLTVAHIHHGKATTKLQAQYRDHAASWVKDWSKQWGLDFYTNRPSTRTHLKSEAELRNFRYKILQNVMRKQKNSILVLAHHGDDLLETQLMRLVRGVGAQGLQSMVFFGDKKFRPLLSFRRTDLLKIAKKLHLTWLEDPSNLQIDPLRNWMRQVWLPQIEKKSPGASSTMIRSFSILNQSNQQKIKGEKAIQNDFIARADYISLGIAEQKSVIAQFLKLGKIKNYSSGHVEEIRRRLDNRCIEYTFTVLKHEWRVNAERIRAVKV